METTRAKAPFDRRVRRTRAAIKQSYLSLCSRKPSGQITVKEVMSLANVNRATFYAHFANLEELTAAIEVDAAEHIEARCEEELAGKDLRSAADIACAVCAAAMGEPDELRRVVSHGSTGRGRDLLREKAWSRWSAALGGGDSEGEGAGEGEGGGASDELAFDLLFDGCLGVIAEWLDAEGRIDDEQVKATIRAAVQKLAG